MSDPSAATQQLTALNVALIAGGASVLVALLTSFTNYFVSTNNLKIPKKTELLHQEITEINGVMANIRQIKSELVHGKSVRVTGRTFEGLASQSTKLVRDDLGQSKLRATRLFEGKKYLLSPEDRSKVFAELARKVDDQTEWVQILDGMHSAFEIAINSHRKAIGVIK